MEAVHLRHYDAAQKGAVIGFRNKNCTGVSGRFFALDDATMIAHYNNQDMGTYNLGTD